ncbi:aminopeptidase [Alicyclobacillus fastidiosus]|uniref:Aminopeptidase n=1 Tax=Alicyclobacillus fastidiosus TaxID=392011 RepID=A0ABV5AE59_9BACL|nr:aminopeptidase [Alicyclobacillus fastidiosus]WEH09871.1 aminopeptidase [Alicyclobacillus fastidiosus]
MTDQLRKYAELAVKVGVNLQPGQNLVVGFGRRQVYAEHLEFARQLVEVAYDAGAKFVQVDWGDEWWMRETVERGSLETLEARAKWQLEWVEHLAKEGAAFIAIPASNPDLYEGVDPARVTAAERAISSTFRDFDNRRTGDQYRWTLASAPTQAWADKVHPELPANERIDALWKDILFCARATGDDPVSDWRAHIDNLSKRSAYLNSLGIQSLHYQAPGTDLTVELAPKHFWTSAEKPALDGVPFVANMPTEEVFTAPSKYGVNGVVTSTMPLNHNGTTIHGIRLKFEKGRIVEFSADQGQDALKRIVEADEGSHYLGEVALVPVDSPIAQMNQLFYNTLFDENASCHLAIGRAYPLVEGGENLAHDDWESHGLNDSLMHVDFMIGSDKMNIDAISHTGETVPIMRDGKWTTAV